MADSRASDDLPAAGDVSLLVDDTGFSEDERAEIEREIEELVSESRTTVSPNDPSLRPRRSGVLFPIVINIIAIGAVVGGIFFLSWYFQDRESDITFESQRFLSTEGQLLQQALRESEEQLAAKEAEISDIQARLQQVAEERQNLEQNLESELSEREAQLRAQLAVELEAERQRLADAGQSEAEIEASLEALEAERQQELQETLAAVRDEAQAELAARQEQLNQVSAELQQTLEASREERERLVEEAAAREAEIRAELGAEIEALEEETAEAQARLARLQEQQEEASLLADRVFGSFQTVIRQIEAENTQAALSGLSSLESLLLRSTTSMQQTQRETQLALVGALRRLVREVDRLQENLALREITTTEEQQRRVEQERAAEMIQAASQVIQLAGEAAGAGRYNEARTLYQQALETIPSLDEVYPGILSLEAERRSDIMRSAVADARSELDAGRNETAITTFLSALRDLAADQDDPLLEVAAGIQRATQANQRAMLEAQNELAERLRAQIDEREQQVRELNQRLLQAQNTVAAREITIESLQDQVETLQQQLDRQTRTLAIRTQALNDAQNRAQTLEDQVAALRTDLREEESRTSSLRDQLSAAREAAAEATAEAEREIRSLEEAVATLRAERTAQANQISVLRSQISRLEDTLGEERENAESAANTLESQVRSLQQRLTAAESEARSLRSTLQQTRAAREEAQAQATAEEVRTLEEQVATLQTERDARSDQVELLRSQVSTLETALEEERSRASDRDTVTELESQLRTLEQDLTAAQSESERLRTALASAQQELEQTQEAAAEQLTHSRETQDRLEAEVEAAAARVTSVQERLETVTQARDTAQRELTDARQELESVRSSLEAARSVVATVTTLRDTYQANLSRATSLSRDGDAADLVLARNQLLESLESVAGRELLPGFVDSLREIDRQIQDAEIASARESARKEAIEDVVVFTTYVQERVGEAESSAEIESRVASLRKDDPALAEAAEEIRELVALANRGISAAPEVTYRLLGSVSRVVSGGQLVVERLVALETEAGDQVQIRRSPGLGQEIALAGGTIAEVEDRRVLVRTGELLTADAVPAERDLVYVVVEE